MPFAAGGPADTLARVRSFLGLPRAAAPEAREVHVGREMDYGSDLTGADVDFLRGIYARDMARLADLTGIRFD